MNYEDYSVEDFVADEYFIQWVKKSDVEINSFWKAWLSKHPWKEPAVREARELVELLQFNENYAPKGKFLEIWENITDADEGKTIELSSDRHVESKFYRLSTWFKVAAAAVLLSVLSYSLFFHKSKIIIRTAYGESRSLFLPDSTKVTLNANSTLSYNPDFSEHNREVWLDGEAFFAVVHKRNNQNFRVHTQELQVEVLGTKFNVNSRRGKSLVVLEEGKVKLDFQQDNRKSQLTMQPGDLVAFSEQNKNIERKKVEGNAYSSWRNNQLVFESQTLAQVAELLEDNYGYEVIFQNDELKEKRFTGSTSADNLQELFQKLDRVFDLEIQQEGNKLIIKI